MSRNIYLDDQGGGVMNVLSEDVAPCLLLNAAKAHGLIVLQHRKRKVIAFAQNTREEVRIINGDGQISGTLDAEGGMHQTTYVVVRKKVPHGTEGQTKWNSRT